MPIEHNSMRNRAISKQPSFRNVRACIKLMRTPIFTSRTWNPQQYVTRH